jgi:hypothetical protein
MRELVFAGLTDTGGLLLTSGDGQQYSVSIDERLVAAVRGDRPRLGQLSIALEGATPRDIQARVRHGQSPEEIAEQTGIPIERVERFAGPPLAERAHVAERAAATEIRREDLAASLSDLLVDALGAAGAEESTLTWDAWRREDGRWSVLARWEGGGEELAGGEATWTYDATDRVLVPEGAAARFVQEGAAEPAPVRGSHMHLVLADDGADRLDEPPSPWGEPSDAEIAAQAHAWDDAPDTATTAVVDRYSGDVVDLAAGPPQEPDTPLDDLLMTDPGIARAHAKPTRRKSRKARTSTKGDVEAGTKPRAVVPSWDEILFGARPPAD